MKGRGGGAKTLTTETCRLTYLYWNSRTRVNRFGAALVPDIRFCPLIEPNVSAPNCSVAKESSSGVNCDITKEGKSDEWHFDGKK